MKIVKYSKESTTAGSSGGSSNGSSGSSSENVTSRGGELDRTIWGKEDRGDDIDGSMVVNGNISIKVINYDWDEEDDDSDGEYEEYEEGGGNLEVELKITSNEVEAKDIYATRHLFINYPSHPDHPEDNKKCIGEIVKNLEDNIKTNSDNIKANKDEIDKLKDRVSTNEGNIKTNADEIEKLKTKTDETASAVNDMMPVGSIIMFNGEASKIPDNWHICDGTNGTPNLIDRFIKAASTSGATGGSNSVTLSSSNIPKMNLQSNVSKINSDKEWNLRLNKKVPTLDEVGEYVFDKGGSSHYTLYTGYDEGDKGLLGVNYPTIFDDVRDYTYIGSDSPSAINIEPSYYALIFIMKIK